MDFIKSIQTRYHYHELKRPFIVAIDGLGGAGKTTVAGELVEVFDQAVIIHMDDHIVERNKRYHTAHESWYEYYFLQWDVPYLTTYLFEKLHEPADQLHLPFYQKQTDQLIEKTVSIPQNGLVIIEGIFLLRDEWMPFYDVSLYLDCPKVVRKKRVLARDTYLGDTDAILKAYETRYWRAEDYYLEKQMPNERADLIVSYHDMI